jgi:hypothetical protein
VVNPTVAPTNWHDYLDRAATRSGRESARRPTTSSAREQTYEVEVSIGGKSHVAKVSIAKDGNEPVASKLPPESTGRGIQLVIGRT